MFIEFETCQHSVCFQMIMIGKKIFPLPKTKIFTKEKYDKWNQEE